MMSTRFKALFPVSRLRTAHFALQALCKAAAGPCKAVFSGLATNAGPKGGIHALALGTAVNADVPAISADAADGWLLLAPYGDVSYWHEEKPGEWKEYTQVFGREQGAKMVAAFNSVLGKKGAKFRGLPIYAGHPDADPKRWPDERRLGGVMALDARADGLYVKAAWNDLGEANLAQGYLVYPSPAWLYNMRDAKRTGRIEPDELRSVGLTNTPRIADVDAWTNSDATPDPNADTTMIKKLLYKILGLPDDATEEQLQTAYNAYFTGDVTAISLQATATNADVARQTAETNVANVTTERDAARTEAARFRTVAINSLLDNAINTGRLTAAERPAFEAQFATNFDTASTALAAKTRALPRQDIEVERDTTDLSTPALRTLAWNTRFDELKAEKGLGTFDQVVAAMRQDPRGKVIIKAMDDANKAKS